MIAQFWTNKSNLPENKYQLEVNLTTSELKDILDGIDAKSSRVLLTQVDKDGNAVKGTEMYIQVNVGLMI